MRANGFEYLLMVDALRDVLYGGTHEGYTKIAVGVRARLPFRVLTMTDPGRVVIDVAHRW
ncbi:AMIN-like domain-containing (lipo)protein [Catenuloplanes indicus]|nr:hypothetical protein [Catenuloplanes indicus]